MEDKRDCEKEALGNRSERLDETFQTSKQSGLGSDVNKHEGGVKDLNPSPTLINMQIRYKTHNKYINLKRRKKLRLK